MLNSNWTLQKCSNLNVDKLQFLTFQYAIGYWVFKQRKRSFNGSFVLSRRPPAWCQLSFKHFLSESFKRSGQNISICLWWIAPCCKYFSFQFSSLVNFTFLRSFKDGCRWFVWPTSLNFWESILVRQQAFWLYVKYNWCTARARLL